MDDQRNRGQESNKEELKKAAEDFQYFEAIISKRNVQYELLTLFKSNELIFPPKL